MKIRSGGMIMICVCCAIPMLPRYCDYISAEEPEAHVLKTQVDTVLLCVALNYRELSRVVLYFLSFVV